MRASGTQGKSHDRYDMIEGALVDISPSGGSDVSTARNAVVAALLGKSMAALSNTPAPFGSSQTSLVLKFTTVRRFAFKKDPVTKKEMKDSKGFPIDDGDSTKWRLIVMGAIASKSNLR